MIVVDTSALMEVILDQPMADACIAVLERADDAAISAGTLAEALMVAGRRGLGRTMSALIRDLGAEIVPVTEAAARRASAAYGRWGRGIHPAGLNHGDCFAYGLAEERGCPLLFVGDGFSRTGIASCL
ncbi:MAG TPA: type II toxin-antitoxin system VapC family toxin [Acetobacteraceae bacterium]|nr:type II toxin-antitoxin system VapC family toxin [Acetobacteraceae bacterium]